MLKLGRVDVDRGEIVGKVGVELNGAWDRCTQHTRHIVYRLIHLNDRRFAPLRSGKGQHLGNQIPCSMPSRNNFVEVLINLFVAEPCSGIHDKFCIADDAREDVVEVVGDTASHLSNGFHPTGLLKLSLNRESILLSSALGSPVSNRRNHALFTFEL